MGAQVLNFDFEGWKIPDRPLPAPSFADDYLVDARTRNALGKGEQYRFAYPNGYGASVIRGQFTYGRSGIFHTLCRYSLPLQGKGLDYPRQ